MPSSLQIHIYAALLGVATACTGSSGGDTGTDIGSSGATEASTDPSTSSPSTDPSTSSPSTGPNTSSPSTDPSTSSPSTGPSTSSPSTSSPTTGPGATTGATGSTGLDTGDASGSSDDSGSSTGETGGLAERCAGPGVLFCDDFESGDLSHVDGDARWTDSVAVEVLDEQARSGVHAARFRFAGNPSHAADADAFAELRFDLGVASESLWISYALYVPAGYEHRDAESSDNNKLFRLWGIGYDDHEKVGASMWPEPSLDSRLIVDWSLQGQGIGPKGAEVPAFIGDDDRGGWVEIDIHVRAATPETFGTVQLWKNGELVIDASEQVNNYTEGEAHAYRYGYLLGWSNSGFTNDTDLYIDDVVISTLAP